MEGQDCENMIAILDESINDPLINLAGSSIFYVFIVMHNAWMFYKTLSVLIEGSKHSN